MSFIICNGKSDTEPSPPKDDQNGKITIDNPPVTTEEPVTPSPPNSDTGRDVGACVVGVGSPCATVILQTIQTSQTCHIRIKTVHSILTYSLNVSQTTTGDVLRGLATMHTIIAFQTVNAPPGFKTRRRRKR